MVVIDSVRFYRPFWICMKILDPTFFGEPTRLLRVYVVALQFLITFCFPLHLLLNVLLHPSLADLFKNLIMTITCSACSLKHVAQIIHLPEIKEIDSLITQLDKFIESEDEHEYYRKHVKSNSVRFTRCLYISFGIIYPIFMLGFLVLVASGTGELIIPAYFPFDWKTNQYLYAVAISYQLLGVLVDGLQGLTNDTYTPLTLCILGGHIHMWAMRMSRLGFEGIESDRNQYRRFVAYIEQHKLLMRFHYLTQKTISQVQIFQLGGCGGTLCLVVSYVLFYAPDMISLIYNLVFIVVVCVQLFPSCYFASVVAEEVQSLPYAIFSSRWYACSQRHRRNLLIFTQLTLGTTGRGRVMKAGGLVELNLNAFYATLKMAYSLFAVVVRVKSR
ncbi:uncharacterized protein Dana_GF21620 [Drosophila ananassae]|uniref:Odorant receptor n=1 Tax=Drosophila ananassae TaxID=7217 RepID=B3MVD8_DROAN|nr:odorant receptor 33c [Drosophila ananassae]EDV33203.1 uncharacterized protein Dana_GF21620 [Drosophila ananassae]